MFERGAGRRDAAGVEGVELSFLGDVDDCEQVGGEAGALRFHDVEHGGRCHRGIDGIAAAHHDLQPGLRRQRLARGDDPMRGHDLGAALRRPTFGAVATNGGTGRGLWFAVADRQRRLSLRP